MLLILLTRGMFAFTKHWDSKGRRRRRMKKESSLPHSLILWLTAHSMRSMLLCLEVYHYIPQFLIRRRRRGFLCKCLIYNAVPWLLSLSLCLSISGQACTNAKWNLLYEMVLLWFCESLPKSNTSIKPQCFRQSVLKCLYLNPYLHSFASPVSLLQHLVVFVQSFRHQWACLRGGYSPLITYEVIGTDLPQTLLWCSFSKNDFMLE